MSKYYEELLKLAEKDEEKVRKLLMQNYITSIVDMKKKFKEYMIINDGLTYAQQLEMKRLDSLIEQISINLKKLYDNNYDIISKYDRETLEREYFGVFYEVENIADINLSFSMLNEKYVQEAIEFPIEGLKLSERLYDKHLMDMKYRVKGAVTQGLINSSGYASIAKTISDIGFTDFNHAMTIAVTEAGRMKSLARQKGQKEAADKGVDLQKKWVSTLDKKTRHSHQKLDGQTVPIDGEFEINGHKAQQPRLFGVASEDIRCRCDTITIVEGIDPILRRDNEMGEIIQYKNYEEWKKHKLSSDNGLNNDNKTVKISKEILNHSSKGEFKNPKNPKKQTVGKFDSGGHGEENISVLKDNRIEYNIIKEYKNGVRIGNVPSHKKRDKRNGTGQAWFPKEWTSQDIAKAGEYVANIKNKNKYFIQPYIDEETGNIIAIYKFSNYNDVTVGICYNYDKKMVTTIFPDGIQRLLGGD